VFVSGEIREHDFTISLPYRDKKRLEAFFRHYCLFEQWAYTLVGVKPATFSLFHTKTSTFLSPRKQRLLGWETWLKYQHYFKNSRFSIFTDQQCSDQMFLFIIDRKQLNHVLSKYSEDFRSVLHEESFEANQLIERAAHKSFLKEVLHDHHGLIGTLLGYGRENAWKFHERELGKEIILTPLWDEEFLTNILAHWNEKPCCIPWDESHLFYPLFAADPTSDESIALRQQYLQAREHILEYYQGKDFVEATLSLFNQRLANK
jgi:hypothetical protein